MLPASSISETVSAFLNSAQIVTDWPTDKLGPADALIPTTFDVWFGGAVSGAGVGVGGGGGGGATGSGGGSGAGAAGCTGAGCTGAGAG